MISERKPIPDECCRQVAMCLQNNDRLRLRAMILIRTTLRSSLQTALEREDCHPIVREKIEELADQADREIKFIESAIRKLPPDLRLVSSRP
jgi:hypothetical protein